jgi:tetratricopeptide (TPR) repeat protein
MAIINCRSVTALAVLFFSAAVGSAVAYADWAACQGKPTRSCVIEEALRGDSGPLTGKERLDVLIGAGAPNHLEYATATDIKEGQRLAKEPSGTRYLYLAIRGLVAANQVQEAFNLVVSSSDASVRNLAFADLARALVKAGQHDKFLALFAQIVAMTPPIDPNHAIVEFVKALADAGKIEEAVATISDVQRNSHSLSDISAADMLMAVAQAYAKRGDTKRADQFFDKAGAAIQTGLQKPPAGGLQQYDPITLRFRGISLSALRGDTAAVKTALQQLPPDSSTPADRVPAVTRMQGQIQLVLALLQKKQFELAIEVAKSITYSSQDRDRALAFVALQYATDGRIDDTRAMISSLGDETKPKIWAPVRAALAVALAKARNISSALQAAEQIGDPASRRAALFLIAQTLSP